MLLSRDLSWSLLRLQEDAAKAREGVGPKFSMGQFRAETHCPVCAEENGASKWTCARCTEIVSTHRELLRYLQQWRSMFEAHQIADVIENDGRTYSLWDLQRFYEHRTSLPDRQCQAIQFCLFENMKESDAAQRMGIKPTNPVSVYATLGLTTLLTRAVSGDLPGYSFEIQEMTSV